MSLLRLELLLQRYGYLPALAILLAATGAWLQWVAMPGLEVRATAQGRRLAALAAEAQAADSAGKTPPVSLVLERYRVFQDRLAAKEAIPDIVRTLFSEAGKAGLVLQKMDYRLQRQAGGEYLVYDLSAPIQGSYAHIYQFAQGVLLSLPAAALEDISFKRDTAASPNTAARLHFAIYLKSGN